jgi:hypothetical protein
MVTQKRTPRPHNTAGKAEHLDEFIRTDSNTLNWHTKLDAQLEISGENRRQRESADKKAQQDQYQLAQSVQREMEILAARFDKYAHSKQVIKPGKGIIKELVLGVENACRMLIDHGLVGPGNHSAMIPAEQVRRTIACATPLRARNGEQCMSRLEFGTWLGLLCDLFDFPTLLGIHVVEKIKEIAMRSGNPSMLHHENSNMTPSAATGTAAPKKEAAAEAASRLAQGGGKDGKENAARLVGANATQPNVTPQSLTQRETTVSAAKEARAARGGVGGRQLVSITAQHSLKDAIDRRKGKRRSMPL